MSMAVNTMQSTKSDFESLSVPQQEVWVRKAIDHLDKVGTSYNENDRDAVVYLTTLYLYNLQDYVAPKIQYPCYVVHCVEDGTRFVTDSYQLAHSKFKKAQARKNFMGIPNRAALFYWSVKGVCEMRYASPEYPFTTDNVPV